MIFFRDFIQGIELPVYSLRRKAFKVFALYVFSGSKIEKNLQSRSVCRCSYAFALFSPGLYGFVRFFRIQISDGHFLSKVAKNGFSGSNIPAYISSRSKNNDTRVVGAIVLYI